MKKKLIIGLAAVLFTAAVIGGTVAYFSKEFTSDNNTASAANFDVEAVNADGEAIADGQFDLGEDLFPGMDTREVYSFQINKNNTDLPVEYSVNLNPSGDLFPGDGSSPIVVTMQRDMDGEWVDVDHENTFKPESDTEEYRILVDWPHGENDIDFQGASGNMKLEVVATQVEPPAEPVETGEAHISLYKDSTSKKSELDFDTISNFYLKNKDTGEIFRDGDTMWNRKAAFEMEDIPVGEYTIHFDEPESLFLDEILLGGAYNETVYDPESNPFVITKEEKGYAQIVLKSDVILDEIKPLEDLTVPSDITYEAFLEALPTEATIVDSTDEEHQVDLGWDVRPFQFENYTKPGERTLRSDFFKLPLNVSNTEPSTRLKVALNVIFE